VTFTEKVLVVVKNIPKGKTLSYRQVAALAGNSSAARAVGAILKANKDLEVPCHRVIRSNGQFGKYNGLRGDKASLLREENVDIKL